MDPDGKDSEDGDLIVDGRKERVETEAFGERDPHFVPHVLGANGTTFGNGLFGRCFRKADVSLGSMSQLGDAAAKMRSVGSAR